jgi:hypothetical protein
MVAALVREALREFRKTDYPAPMRISLMPGRARIERVSNGSLDLVMVAGVSEEGQTWFSVKRVRFGFRFRSAEGVRSVKRPSWESDPVNGFELKDRATGARMKPLSESTPLSIRASDAFGVEKLPANGGVGRGGGGDARDRIAVGPQPLLCERLGHVDEERGLRLETR